MKKLFWSTLLAVFPALFALAQPDQIIELTTVTPLSKAEVQYALETLLEWSDAKVVFTDDKTLKFIRGDGDSRR